MSSTAPPRRSTNAPRRTDGGDKRSNRSSKNEPLNKSQTHQQSSVNHNTRSSKQDPNQVNNNHSKPSDAGHESKSKRMQMTQEQLRIASLMNEKTDLTELETKVKTLMSLTRIDFDSAIVALHDCDGDLEAAADKILVDDFKNDFIESKPRKSKLDKANAQVAANERDKSGQGGNRTNQVRGRGSRGGGGSGGNFKPRNEREPRPENGERRERRERPPREERPEGVERDNERGFRGRGGRGNGNFNRGRGSRTFVNNARPVQPREVEVIDKPVPGSPRNDTLGDKIGTWEPTDGSKPAAAPISHLTVGNWSDVVREDLSEDETTSGKISSAVFVPSGKTLREDPEPPASGFDQRSPHSQQQQQHPPIDQNRTAGAQLLQSLKQSPNQQVQSSTVHFNHSASESLKSLVGISAQTYVGSTDQNKSPSANSMNQQSGKKITRIPSTAVEMPSNDPVTALGVQFGALEVNFDGHVQQQASREYEQHSRNASDKPASGPHSSILGSANQADDRSKGYVNKSGMDAAKSTDLYQNSGQQSGQVSEGYKSAPAPGYGPTPGYTTGFSNASVYNAYSNQASSYSQQGLNYSNKNQQSLTALRDFQDSTNTGQKYPDLHNSGFVSSTQTTNVIKNSLPATGKGQMPNVQAQLPAQMMHPSYINVVSSPVGLAPFYPVYPDPTQMQVTAAGGRTDLSTGFTNYPSGPNLAQTQGIGTDSSKYTRSSQDESHGSVSSVPSSQTVNVSQAGQHSVGQPPFINMPSFPPGYGYYFAAMPQQGIHAFPTHGTPFVPVPSASNSTGAGVGNLFGKGNSGYPSYGQSSNAYEVNSSDGYKQQQQQSSNYGQPRNVLSSDLMTGVSGSGSGTSGFGGKGQSSQGSKVGYEDNNTTNTRNRNVPSNIRGSSNTSGSTNNRNSVLASLQSSYDKMNPYQSPSGSTPGSYNMPSGMSGTAAASAYQGASYSMVGHSQQQPMPQSFQEAANQNRSNQRNPGSGAAGNKGYGNYGQW